MNYSDMLKASQGANLWFPWETEDDVCLYYTFGYVDLDNAIIKTSLAKAIQRSGVIDSLGPAYRAIDSINTVISRQYVGHINGEEDLVFCDQTGETPYDGHIDEDEPRAITLVEIDTDGD